MDDASEELYFLAMLNLNIGHVLFNRKFCKRKLKHAIYCFGYSSIKINDYKFYFRVTFRIEYRENIFWPTQGHIIFIT